MSVGGRLPALEAATTRAEPGGPGDGAALFEELLRVVKADAAPGAQGLDRDQFLAVVATEMGNILARDPESLPASGLDFVEAGMAGNAERGEQSLQVARLVPRRGLVPGFAVGGDHVIAADGHVSAAQARLMRLQASSSTSVEVA